MSTSKRKRVYCKQAFLDSFFDVWKGLDPIRDADRIIRFKATYDMLTIEDVLLDISRGTGPNDPSDAEIKEIFDKYDWLFMKESPAQCIGDSFPDINLILKKPTDIKTEILFSTILTDEDSVDVINFNRRFGIPVLNVSSIDKNLDLFKDSGTSIIKGINYNSWYSLLKGSDDKYLSNAILIVDRYIISNDRKNNENLFSILRSLLPKNVVFPNYQIIICVLDSTSIIDNKTINSISSEISKISPYLNFTLTIYSCKSSDFHDRGIVSNNFMIQIGAGFDIIRMGKASMGSDLSIVFPFFYFDRIRRSAYYRICQEYITMKTEFHRPALGKTDIQDRFLSLI